MSRLNRLEELMSNPEYDGRTRFLVDDNEKLVGTNNANELFVLYHKVEVYYINFLPHEYVVHLLESFYE